MDWREAMREIKTRTNVRQRGEAEEQSERGEERKERGMEGGRLWGGESREGSRERESQRVGGRAKKTK